MANKRDLKKLIGYVCGGIAAQSIITREFIPGADAAKLDKVVVDLAVLQEHARANATFSFDKTPRDYANGHEYRKAAGAYRRAAYARLREEFNARLQDIVKELNQAIPEEQRQENKKAAAAK